MANTAALIGTAYPNKVSFLLTGDGTVAGPTLANALGVQAVMVAGPLKDLWNATYADQAAMRAALLAGAGRVTVQLLATPVDTTAERNQVQVDVDVDAVTATKAEINVSMSDTTGQLAILTLEYVHTAIR